VIVVPTGIPAKLDAVTLQTKPLHVFSRWNFVPPADPPTAPGDDAALADGAAIDGAATDGAATGCDAAALGDGDALGDGEAAEPLQAATPSPATTTPATARQRWNERI
jgi:hypothetical protein